MNDERDPLWNPALGGDASLRRLEALLVPFSARARGLHERLPPAPASGAPAGEQPSRAFAQGLTHRRARLRRGLLLRVAASVALALSLVAIGMAYRLSWSEHRAWTVRSVGGPAPASARMAPGDVVRAGTDQVLDIAVARIGRVAVSPGSTVRLVETRAGRHRMALDSGHLRARIWAPPGYFSVASGTAEVVDLGCDFDLWQQPDGSNRLFVRSGWVAHRVGTREILVPAGYALGFDARLHDTPLRPDATAAVVEATAELVRAIGDPGAGSAQARAAADSLARAATDADRYTLLHLLTQYPELASGPLYPRLAVALATAADDRTHRAAWVAGDRAAIDRWWHRLPVQPKSWWRHWADAFR
jgi:hypothetical protein